MLNLNVKCIFHTIMCKLDGYRFNLLDEMHSAPVTQEALGPRFIQTACAYILGVTFPPLLIEYPLGELALLLSTSRDLIFHLPSFPANLCNSSLCTFVSLSYYI